MRLISCFPDTSVKVGGKIFPSLRLENLGRRRFNNLAVVSCEQEATWGTNTIAQSGEICSVDDL